MLQHCPLVGKCLEAEKSVRVSESAIVNAAKGEILMEEVEH